MLSQELGKVKRMWIMSSIIMIAVGIVMIMCPVSYMSMFISTLGYILLVMASITMLEFASSKKVLINYIYLTVGILAAILGLFVLLQSLELLPMLGFLFGVILVVEGINDFGNAYTYARRAGHAAWVTLAVLSVLTIIFGVFLLVNPWWHSTEVIKNVIGCMLLLTSVFGIIRIFIVWPFKNI